MRAWSKVRVFHVSVVWHLRAVRSECLPVRLAVAVGAGAELEAAVDLVDVALRAVDRSVGAGQREPGFRVIELLSRVGERRGRRVACRAGRPERALVRVLMARHARRARIQERPRLVTPRTVAGKRGMAAIQREPGLHSMVECLDVEPSDVHRGTAMFSVALLAGSRDIAVNASSSRQSAPRWAYGKRGISQRRARGPVGGTSGSWQALRVASGPWRAVPARRSLPPAHPPGSRSPTRARPQRQPSLHEKKNTTGDRPCSLTGARTRRGPEIER